MNPPQYPAPLTSREQSPSRGSETAATVKSKRRRAVDESRDAAFFYEASGLPGATAILFRQSFAFPPKALRLK